jgi:CubicO group peptidase (beta-lactamase class C family)
LPQSYGFGFAINPDGSFGHGGAYATNLTIDPARGLVTVWMVQNAGSPPEWKKCGDDFKKWAYARFGN